MNALAPSIRADDEPDPAAAAQPPAGRAVRALALLERFGERLNPILVKECRQALKSRQFGLTFAALLACSWLWSIVGIAMIGPNAYYSFSGPEMFMGYFIVLSFALLVTVPFSAFSSLAGEWSDRTFELVSITTLHSRRIIAGKLGSAVVQMLVYLSAIAPCLAFTYLLRGIDIVTIAFIIAYLFAGSLALAMAALLLSTSARERHWQIVQSIGLLIGLFYCFIGGCVLGSEILEGRVLEPNEHWFWIGHAALLTAYVAYFVMMYLAAAAQLSFVGDNRSTPLRVTMVVQFLLFTGWMAGISAEAFSEQSHGPREAIVAAFVLLTGLHWYAMGAFLVLEQPVLSTRVKRSLPQSFLGRMFLTWFNPGPGTGYLFAVGGMLATAVIGIGTLMWLDASGHLSPNNFTPVWRFSAAKRITLFTVVGTSYVVFFLGLGKMLVAAVRPYLSLGIFSGLAVQLLLLLAATGVPMIIEGLTGTFRTYTLLHLTNPFWTLAEGMERNPAVEYDAACIAVPLIAAFVFLFNLPSAAREVQHTRIAAPLRVLEDESKSADA